MIYSKSNFMYRLLIYYQSHRADTIKIQMNMYIGVKLLILVLVLLFVRQNFLVALKWSIIETSFVINSIVISSVLKLVHCLQAKKFCQPNHNTFILITNDLRSRTYTFHTVTINTLTKIVDFLTFSANYAKKILSNHLNLLHIVRLLPYIHCLT